MSYLKIQSPAQAESDQKDIIIRQLKDDIMALKKTEGGYEELTASIMHMDNCYATLDQERLKSSQMYEAKHKSDGETISNLKKNSENLSSTQRKKQVEVFELKGDHDNLQTESNERTNQLNALKEELAKNKDINTKLTGEKQQMENNLEQLQKEIRLMTGELEQNQRRNDQSVILKNENEQTLSQLGFQKNLMEKSFAQTQTQNTALNLEDQTRKTQKNYLEQQRAAGAQAIDQLEKDLKELAIILDNQKQECAKNLGQMKDEQQRGQDLTVRLQNLEALLNQRNLQVGDIRKENDRYRNENLELMNTNQQLSYDLESLKKHIDQLVERNSQVENLFANFNSFYQFLNDFDTYTKEDEQLSILLNRKYRVHDIRMKADDRIRQALMMVQGEAINRSMQQ